MRAQVKSGLHRVVRAAARVRPRGAAGLVRVLTYHQVAPTSERITDPYNQVTLDRLWEQVSALRSAGLKPVSLTHLWRLLQQDATSAAECVALTFDDGLEEHREHVAPLLARLGAGATFYIPTGCLGRPVEQLGYEGRHLDAEGVRELSGAGFEIGSHSRSHPVLSRCGPDRLHAEIHGSRRDLADILGEEPASFAYPYGSRRTFNENIVRQVKAARYETGVSTVIGGNGPGTPAYELRRLPVYQFDDGRITVAKARGAMDWLGGLQELWLRVFPHSSTR